MEYNFLREEDKEKVDEDTKINLKLISSIIYHHLISIISTVCKIVNPISDPKKKRQEQTGLSRDIKVFIEKIEQNFIKGDIDTNENMIEYIELNLYKPSMFKKYTDGCKEYNFSLSKVIFEFINKFFDFMENS